MKTNGNAGVVFVLLWAFVGGAMTGAVLEHAYREHAPRDFPQCVGETLILPKGAPMIDWAVDRSKCDPRDTKRYPKGCWTELDFLSPPSAPAPH